VRLLKNEILKIMEEDINKVNERFEKVVNEINHALTRLASLKHEGRGICDYSDIGNSIGIIIEENKDEENDRCIFEMGLRHGYSLVDGTHDHPRKIKKSLLNRIKRLFK
jgi:hypothetical protein